jgi:hypothetical protein
MCSHALSLQTTFQTQIPTPLHSLKRVYGLGLNLPLRYPAVSYSLSRALFLKVVGSSMGSVIVVIVVEGVVITAGLLYLDRLEVFRFGGSNGALER